jgi:hypothetical protein
MAIQKCQLPYRKPIRDKRAKQVGNDVTSRNIPKKSFVELKILHTLKRSSVWRLVIIDPCELSVSLNFLAWIPTRGSKNLNSIVCVFRQTRVEWICGS